MTVAWITVAALFAITVGFKAAGPIAVGGRELPARTAAVVALVAPALLAALVVYETIVAERGGVSIDARLIGFGAAAAAVLVRAPLLAVAFLAACATALARAIA
jgi:hypothetical protein